MINGGIKNSSKDEYKVGIADWKVTSSPNQIITLGLGSCVGIVLYDKSTKIGGMVHIMLPDSTQFRKADKPAKFADTGIELLYNELLKYGANKAHVFAKIAGGAQMFKGHTSNLLNIGERNTIKTKEVLKELGLPLHAEATGGNKGRTLILETDTGRVLVRTVGAKPYEI